MQVYLGAISAVLANPDISTLTSGQWNPAKLAKQWVSAQAQTLVNAGLGSTLMTFSYWPGTLNGAAQLNTLPTFQMSAQDAATYNYPPELAQVGGANYPASSTGVPVVGSSPINFAQTPLTPLAANQYIAPYSVFAVPGVYETVTVTDSNQLPSTGVPSAANYQFILDALQALMTKAGVTVAMLALCFLLTGCAATTQATATAPQAPQLTVEQYVQVAAATDNAAAHELLAVCTTAPGASAPLLDATTCSTVKSYLTTVEGVLSQISAEAASATDTWAQMKVKIAGYIATATINATVSNASLKSEISSLQATLTQILAVQ
jgi:hypothetical protein